MYKLIIGSVSHCESYVPKTPRSIHSANYGDHLAMALFLNRYVCVCVYILKHAHMSACVCVYAYDHTHAHALTHTHALPSISKWDYSTWGLRRITPKFVELNGMRTEPTRCVATRGNDRDKA